MESGLWKEATLEVSKLISRPDIAVEGVWDE